MDLPGKAKEKRKCGQEGMRAYHGFIQRVERRDTERGTELRLGPRVARDTCGACEGGGQDPSPSQSRMAGLSCGLREWPDPQIKKGGTTTILNMAWHKIEGRGIRKGDVET